MYRKEQVRMKQKKNWLAFVLITFVSLGIIALICHASITRPAIFICRLEIFLLLYLFLILHCFFDVRKMYDWIHKHRLIIGIALFVFCVANCFNGSSLGMFNEYIQPGEGTDLISPILGRARAIRSDEWMVNVPRLMSAGYSEYGPLNDLVRATTSSNLVASGGLQLDYAALRDPSSWGYYLFGSEYGLSFQWSYRLIVGFLLWYELFIILTKGKRILSVFGASLIWFSTFNLWWSIVTQLITGPAIVVLFYYYIKQHNRTKRLLIGSALAIAGADYVCALYPAWQVPMGFIILSMMIWILIENDEWRHYQVKDWVVFSVNIFFMVSIIARFIWIDMEYITGISETVYPGARVEYGGMSVQKLLGYLYVMLAFIMTQANPCEMSCIAVVFPLGILLDVYVLYKQKGKNTLLICLSVPMLLLLLFCTTGLPPIIAKLFLMTYSTALRAVDYLGIVLAIIMIVAIGEIHDGLKVNVPLAVAFSCTTIIPSLLYCLSLDDRTIVRIALIVLACIMICTIVLVLVEYRKLQYSGQIFASVALISTGMLVNPIMVGTDAISSKPAFEEIQKLVDKNSGARWVGLNSIVLPQFVLACGAPTVNSINYIPNYEMWEILDPNKKYEEVWNRYAHMVVSLSDDGESHYELLGLDSIQLRLNRQDFLSIDIDFVVTQNQISGEWTEILESVYEESGIWIYKVIL